MVAQGAGEGTGVSFAVGFGRDLLSGGLSGIASKTVAAPVERVKLLLQTQQVNRDLATQYTGAFDCARRVYREQGLWSFWRGNVANLLRYFPSQALSFAFKDLYKDLLGLGRGGSGSSSSGSGGSGAGWWFIGGNLLAAGAAGGTAMVLLYPLEMARTRMAADVSGAGQARRFSGTLHCLASLYGKHGVAGLYSGLPVALVGQVAFRGLYMGGYDVAKGLLPRRTGPGAAKGGGGGDLLARLGAAQVVTTVAGTLCYPLDTVRRRLMMQTADAAGAGAGVETGGTRGAGLGKGQSLGAGPERMYYRSGWHCFRRILREEGARGLFSGLGANLVRGVSGSLLLVGYDEIRAWIDKML